MKSISHFLFHACENHPTEYPPEMRGARALWRAVIVQALEDAVSKSIKSKEQFHKTQAMHWLTHGNQDFMLVCDYADIDPDYARKKIKSALSRGCKWRADAGFGKDAEKNRLRKKKQKERLAASTPTAGHKTAEGRPKEALA